MKSFINSVSISGILTSFINRLKNDPVLFWLIIVVTVLAFLEVGQDYIKSVLNNSPFSILQSLSYKLFWFLFIPFTFLFLHLQIKYNLNKGKSKAILNMFVLIIVITLLHLLVFSIFLHIVSFRINENPWALSSLITQKLSTRLYLGLSFYIIFSFVYYYLILKIAKSRDQNKTLDTLPIKYGSKTTFVNTKNINWIVSDGPYLEVNTPENKYVILGSLKNIINSLPDNFRRIHKSTIVNMDQLESSKSRGNGDYDLVLKCGKIVRLSRNYAKALKSML